MLFFLPCFFSSAAVGKKRPGCVRAWPSSSGHQGDSSENQRCCAFDGDADRLVYFMWNPPLNRLRFGSSFSSTGLRAREGEEAAVAVYAELQRAFSLSDVAPSRCASTRSPGKEERRGGAREGDLEGFGVGGGQAEDLNGEQGQACEEETERGPSPPNLFATSRDRQGGSSRPTDGSCKGSQTDKRKGGGAEENKTIDEISDRRGTSSRSDMRVASTETMADTERDKTLNDAGPRRAVSLGEANKAKNLSREESTTTTSSSSSSCLRQRAGVPVLSGDEVRSLASSALIREREDHAKVVLYDGDRIACLFSLVLFSLLKRVVSAQPRGKEDKQASRPPLSPSPGTRSSSSSSSALVFSPPLRISVVQTAYANGGSTGFLEKLQALARKSFDPKDVTVSESAPARMSSLFSFLPFLSFPNYLRNTALHLSPSASTLYRHMAFGFFCQQQR